MKKVLYSVIGLMILFSLSINAQSIDQKVEALLSKMTLEEKVGQMNQYNGFWNATGPAPTDGNAKQKYDHLRTGMVGSVLNVRGAEEVRKMQELVVNESRLGIPLIFGSDIIHGYKTLSPIPLAEVASWDMDMIEASARMAAQEATAVGVNWTFAPMVDISRDPRWGRVMEGAGEDPFLGSAVARARVKGFQGDDLSAHNTMAACIKHLAGYGFAEAGKDYNTVDVGLSTLHNVILPPFKAAVGSGVRTAMNSFNTLNGIPATGDKYLQRDVLKGLWGFEGFVVSDWSSGAEMIAHGYAEDLKDVAVKSANAGSDMDMESSAYVHHLVEAVREGLVDVSVVDDAVKRILTLKFELGLFDDPYRYCDVAREKEMLYNEEHLATALEMAKRSIVLLKNENNLLPLKKDQKNIAVIGALADDKSSPLGGWRVGSDDGTAISVLEGLTAYTQDFTYAQGATVLNAPGEFIREVDINETDKSGFAEAIELARTSEVVVMVLGEPGFQSGEGRSRSKLGIPGVQQELLEAVYEVNQNIVLVLTNGRPLTINWADDHIPAILESWQLGTQSGHAIAQVLFGDYNPSGKLPMTFPKSVGQIPIYYNHFNTGRPGPIELVFWSHYMDESNEPLYPFGYGLSYTTFDYGAVTVDTSDFNSIKVSCTITNTGTVAGEEVVQLYIRDRIASVVRPVKELKGFEKIRLEPGASSTVTFALTDAELLYYNNDGTMVIESGDFDVMVGGSSVGGKTGAFRLQK